MRVIVALDVETPDIAWSLIDAIEADAYKIGLELLYHPDGVRFAAKVARDWHLFVDAKLSDIPTTVARATRQICESIAPTWLSVRANIDAALSAAHPGTTIVDVSTLTSDLTAEARVSPAHAVVCRPQIVENMRALNPAATIICPGVRLPGEGADDHVGGTALPSAAHCIVVGRPITRAPDPRKAYLAYVAAVNGLQT